MKKPMGSDIQSRQMRHASNRKIEFGGGVNKSSYEKSTRRHSAKHNALASRANGRTATPADRKKDPYLSADSKVWK